jgi:AhpD family alkylhydroperoxidase
MDVRLRELISLGASVSAHCFPCFDHHLEQARKLGIVEEEILESIRAGFMVMNGAGDKMCEKIKATFPQISLAENDACSPAGLIGATHFAPMVRY